MVRFSIMIGTAIIMLLACLSLTWRPLRVVLMRVGLGMKLGTRVIMNGVLRFVVRAWWNRLRRSCSRRTMYFLLLWLVFRMMILVVARWLLDMGIMLVGIWLRLIFLLVLGGLIISLRMIRLRVLTSRLILGPLWQVVTYCRRLIPSFCWKARLLNWTRSCLRDRVVVLVSLAKCRFWLVVKLGLVVFLKLWCTLLMGTGICLGVWTLMTWFFLLCLFLCSL